MSHRRVCALVEIQDAHTLLVQLDSVSRRLRLMDVSPESGIESDGRRPSMLGRRTLRWAQEVFFKNVREIQIETPDESSLLSNSGNMLAHVFVRGESYNVRLVREGFSPCFEKYGHPLTYREELERAEEWARREGRGLWGGATVEEYRELKRWWLVRAGQVEGFRHAVDMGEDIVDVRTHYHEVVSRARARTKPVVFGDVNGKWEMADGATLLQLGSPRQPMCAYFSPELRGAAMFLVREYHGIGKPNYLYCEAPLSLEADQPQITIESPDQVTTFPPRTRG